MDAVLPITIDELNQAVRSKGPNDQAFIACLLASIGAWRAQSAPELLRRVSGAINGEMVMRTRFEPSDN
jgi:hypothetical protein